MNSVCLNWKIRKGTDDHPGLDFEEELLPVQLESDEQPQSRSPQALEEPLPVGVLEAPLPAEREVEAQESMANVYKEGVHPWGGGEEEKRQTQVVIEQDWTGFKGKFHHWSRYFALTTSAVETWAKQICRYRSLCSWLQ